VLKLEFEAKNIINRLSSVRLAVIFASPVEILSNNFCVVTGNAMMLDWKGKG
jgi:hypothetical protein